MLIDTAELPQDTQLRYDVCIIGAGAAGITLANALRTERRSVGLIESGGFALEPETQSLYRGVARGVGLRPDTYLHRSRLRLFGGATNHWAGMCRPLDPLDFSIRPWVPHSGWPITHDQLAPYYRRSAEVVEVEPFDDQWGVVTSHAESIIAPNGALIGRTFRYSPPTRFGRVYRAPLVEADTVQVLLHANVVHIDLNDAGTAVERIHIMSLRGTRLTATARHFVLAAGGVENARLLLVSNSVHKSGLGNGSDCVGRFFMEHPEGVHAHITLTSQQASDDLDLLKRRDALLCLSEETQRTEELLNANIQAFPPEDMAESPAGGTPLDIQDLLTTVDGLRQASVSKGASAPPRGFMELKIRSESAPRPESRVTLEDRDTDALGMRRVRLDFRTTTLESRTYVRALEIVARALGATGGGRLRTWLPDAAARSPMDGPPWQGLGAGQHHIGTTRMSDTPAGGVVDTDCRVHGVTNLYVAGSSVFPTSGMANPTFTIVALALRMAEHLAVRLQR